MSSPRPYRGIDATDRRAQRRQQLLDAGLELLAGTDRPLELTVRALCGTARVSARYFYESFTDKDDLVTAVFDRVIADIAATTTAAVAAAAPTDRNRAGVANLVHEIGGDVRIGRLLFDPQLAHPVLARKRAEAGGTFALLSGQHAADAHRMPHDAGTAALAHFVVGGVGQTLGAWVAGELELTRDQLVEHLTGLLDGLSRHGAGAYPRPQPTG